MADVDDLIENMRVNPADIRFAEAKKVASHHFGEPRQTGSSHCVWKMPWAGDPRVNLQEDKGGKAKAYQVRQLLTAIDKKLAAAQATAGEAVPAEAFPPPSEAKKKKKPKKKKG